ncbi:putative metal ABC transporter, periplasmic metal-binding adhesion liprotein [Fibrobacter succinogenes subsp. succinogenes S85]|uniref:Periplasmic solute binding protein n=1 Tax=Fibrobacter succinogenes (strain ATCC 19169 / S85) TaxID=59374 RepID=C9RQF9_FIBSS|nr:metal ABC transporter substrate-binding protein [Fibrobacter succinogenes]ACX74795.1 periplasmic solute binding protein [Fibrobacter succinogenes subsp. succinogenes S85]ADL27414.1 putative metal ABC transporter, periplasmic metal-binding adhesion liprotein [Fibrobacter succinogenes subsp. succinogenes S85]
MKKIYSLACAIFVAALFAFVACNDAPQNNTTKESKLSVVTTIFPEFSWAKSILGDQTNSVDLALLIKNGIDLHSFKPTAQDIAKIASADMVIYVGGESDDWIEKALEATPKKGRTEINLMKVLGDRVKVEEVVEGMQAEEEHEHHHHDEEVENDEHVWLSLKNAEIIVNKIAEELSKLDAAHATVYKQNADAYIAQIQSLDKEYREAVNGATRKTVLFGDRFPFRYLVDDYGIKYYAAFVGCSAESEASFETIAFLAGKMDAESLPVIFTIENSNDKIAKAVLAASKNSKSAQILSINSMQSITEAQIAGGIDYLSLMKSNLDVLKKALN